MDVQERQERISAFWRYVHARRELEMRRRSGTVGPWTRDRVLQEYRFTNVYRASDRVSQYLIRYVLYEGDQDPAEVVFRSLLFRIFNQIGTYARFRAVLGGYPSLSNWDVERYTTILDTYASFGGQIWNNAYMITPPKETYNGAMSKHQGWLRILDRMVRGGVLQYIPQAPSLSAIYDTLEAYETVGRFFAWQWTVDLNYSVAVNFDENSFVVPGGGAVRGAQKLYGDEAIEWGIGNIIHMLTKTQEAELANAGPRPFVWLGGKRRLHLMDVQNCLCEFDKYSRVAYPQWALAGKWYQTIKQRYSTVDVQLLPPEWYPPKWGLNGD